MSLKWRWRGRMAHAVCTGEQRARRDAIIAGTAEEVIWLVEHPPTVTVGRRPAPGTPDADELAARGIAYARTERGGLATYHGPGQLVVYPLISLLKRGFTVRSYIHRLEQVAIDHLQDLGVEAGRHDGARGVFVGKDKIAAIGVHIRRGVSMHGLALNVDPDLGHFGLIVPCGLRDVGVTSLIQLGRASRPIQEIASEFGLRVAQDLESH